MTKCIVSPIAEKDSFGDRGDYFVLFMVLWKQKSVYDLSIPSQLFYRSL